MGGGGGKKVISNVSYEERPQESTTDYLKKNYWCSYQSYGSHCHRINRLDSHKGSLRVDSYDEKRDFSKEDFGGYGGTLPSLYSAAQTTDFMRKTRNLIVPSFLEQII